MPRFFLEISYNGVPFNGWQTQENTPHTIQNILETTLSLTLKHKITITGCGRTDAGVHAKQSFAHFDTDNLLSHPFDFWIYKWNCMLPEEIAIKNIFLVTNSAHARFDAISRTYEYYIHQKKDPFLSNRSYFLHTPLDFTKISKAIEIIAMHKDFACFTKAAEKYNNTICHISFFNWSQENNQIKFTITANRFLRNMVRAIMGTLLWISNEKIDINDLEKIIAARDRKLAGFSVPAEGLYLSKVEYPDALFINNIE